MNSQHQSEVTAVCPHCWQSVTVDQTQFTYAAHEQAKSQAPCPLSNQALRPLFPLGAVVATVGAAEAIEQASLQPNLLIAELLQRHQMGDWGEVPPEDAQENLFSVRRGFRILSAYTLSTGVKLWLITEADRSVTTFLKPEEY